jgi:hypothetical protein
MKILTNYDFSQNQLLNAVWQKLATAPSNPVSGQKYYNTTSNREFYYNGTEWIPNDALGATMTGDSIITAINGSSSLIDDNNLSANVNDAITKKHSHANQTVLDSTTAIYTTALDTKLNGISAGADVTSATNVGTSIHGATAKTSLVDADEVAIINSASSNVLSKITYANLKTTIKAYTDTLYNNYVLPVATSGALGGVKSGTDITVDASGNVSVNDDSHNHIISNIDNLQTTLDGKTPFATLTATTPATAGWYRIATSAVNIGMNAGLFKVDFSGTGIMGSLLFRASCHNGIASASSINQLGFTTSASSLGLTQVRLVYHTTYTANYAYVEIYNPTALAITYAVDLIDTTGWSLVAPSTAGSIPTGYTSETLTCDTGVVSMEDVTATLQLRSNVATGTAPLVVASSTLVANLNAQYLNGQASTYYAPLASPALTGTPTAPTATAGTNTTQLATTAFVTTAVANKTTITGNAGTATKWATARNVTFSGGDVTGTFAIDGSADVTAINLTVVDDSHNHVISNIDNLQMTLDAKETPAGAQSKADTALNSAKAYADQVKADILGGAQSTLDTLYEFQQAINSDPNFSTTMLNLIGTKAGKYSGTVGDGTATSFVLTHGLNTQDVSVTIRETVAPYAIVQTDVECTSTTTVTIRFAVPPTTGQYQVVVMG